MALPNLTSKFNEARAEGKVECPGCSHEQSPHQMKGVLPVQYAREAANSNQLGQSI